MQRSTRSGAVTKAVKAKAMAAKASEFSVQGFLETNGIDKKVMPFRRGEPVFTQGDACEHVWYIQSGGIKLSVLSKTGKEAVVAMLGPGDFFGEGCLAGQEVRMGSATAITPSEILCIDKGHMSLLLHKQHAMSDRFISYREFTLGSSVASVTSVTRITERDLKTVHSRPALVQEVTWQPRYMTGPPAADLASINEMVFGFVDDQLFQMTVSYERNRTTGLTNADMIAALTERYGVPIAAPVRPRATSEALDAPTVIAEWRQEDAHVALRRSRYNESFSIVITSLSLDAVARKARASAVAMDAREAPEREAALAKKRVDEQRQAEERARTTNKELFQP
jgi:CRP-like cAMP-binding protein